MPKKPKSRNQVAPPPSSAGDLELSPGSSSVDEQRVWAVIEAARQRVKALTKLEQEGMVLRSDLMNLRLQAPQ